MDERLLTKIGVTIVVVVMIFRGLRDIRRYMKVEIPQQLTQLVRQAHLDQPFQTMWNIEVSDEIRTPIAPHRSANTLFEAGERRHDQSICIMRSYFIQTERPRVVRCGQCIYQHQEPLWQK